MWSLTCLLLALSLVEGRERLDPLVDTLQGLIRGLRSDDGTYSIFLGIPYGKIGDNPFGVAEPHPNFESTFEAYQDPSACPQFNDGTAFGTLDCLRLNIFVPTTASSKNKLPVLVWIHGGAFNTGYTHRNNYGPKYLVKHDVILVTFNYRVGPYGFMCLDTPEVPGNQGLKDQLLALRWIKKNIASFGGDTNKITLMGESAGSVSVEIQLLSKQEKLFNKVILMSGAAVKPLTVIDSDLSVPLKISEQLGFKTDDVSKALSFLITVDPLLVVAASSQQSISLRPCVEKDFENVESILADYPWNLKVPKVKDMPVINGFVEREGLSRDVTNPKGYFEKENYLREAFELIFKYDENFKEMEDLVRHFYFGDEELTDDIREKIIDFESDFYYIYATQWSGENLLRNGAQNVFNYMFSYEGGKNIQKIKYNITRKGAAHADELGYMFEFAITNVESSQEDQLMIDRITKLWTDFVKYGNPTPEPSELIPITWTPITKDTINYLNIDSELSMRKRPLSDRMAFWELFFKANHQKLKGYHIN